MRHLLLGVLGSVLLVTACATPAGSSDRPNNAQAMENGQQLQPKDPHDFLRDPTVGSQPPRNTGEKPLCHLQCGPNTHCDASGIIERCVPDEVQKR